MFRTMNGYGNIAPAVFAFVLLVVQSIPGAETNSVQVVSAAARRLGEEDNYSWRTTVVVPEATRFRPGAIYGKTMKGGLTHVVLSVGTNSVQAVLYGDKAAATSRSNTWQSLSEIEGNPGPAKVVGLIVRRFKTPAAQALQLVADSTDLGERGGVYSGALTEKGAKALLTFGSTLLGAEEPEVVGARGFLKFWLEAGSLVQYEFTVQGTVRANGTVREIDRRTTIEIKDVGTTTIEIPEDAKKKLI